MNTTLYLKIEKNNEVTNKKVSISDIATVWCADKNIISKINTIRIMNIKDDRNRRYAFSVMKVIELINKECPDIEVVNIGEADFLIDYENKQGKNESLSSVLNILKIVVICLITFIGSAYVIMAYNNDVGVSEVFERAYKIFLGDNAKNYMIIEVMYSIGLTAGIVIFYNHFGGKKVTSDPTPLEVEMNTLESDIDDTLIERSIQKKKEGNC